MPVNTPLSLQKKIEVLSAQNVVLQRQIEELSLPAKGIEAATDMVLITNREGLILWVNDAFIKETGYSREESLGKKPGKLISSGRHPVKVFQSMWTTILSGDTWSGSLINRRRDGSLYRIALNISPILDPGGEVQSFVGMGRVVADQKEPKMQGQMLRQMIGQLPQPFAYIDEDFVFHWANSAFIGLFKEQDQSLVGKKLSSLYEPEVFTREVLPSLNTALGGEPVTAEIPIKDARGKIRWLLQNYSAYRNDHGVAAGIVLHFLDITSRRETEKQLLRVQRMESIGTLAGGIAHDLNNILAPILMASGYLMTMAPDEKSRSILDKIRKNAQRGSDLVTKVLSFAKGVDGSKSFIDLRALLVDLQDTIGESFPVSVTINLQFEADLLFIEGDQTQIQQVFLNLLVNARDAMPEGGVINLKARETMITRDPTDPLSADLAPGKYLEIVIQDSGTGIPGEIIGRIFEPFFSTKTKSGGTGLGLSTSMGIMRSHHGTITAESEPHQGSTFRVYFPIMPSEDRNSPN